MKDWDAQVRCHTNFFGLGYRNRLGYRNGKVQKYAQSHPSGWRGVAPVDKRLAYLLSLFVDDFKKLRT